MVIKCKLHLYMTEDPEWPYIRKTRGDRGFRTVLDGLRITLTERVSRVVLPFRPPSALDEVNNSSLIGSGSNLLSNDRSELSSCDTIAK
jgi:hypothetical protein